MKKYESLVEDQIRKALISMGDSYYKICLFKKFIRSFSFVLIVLRFPDLPASLSDWFS